MVGTGEFEVRRDLLRYLMESLLEIGTQVTFIVNRTRRSSGTATERAISRGKIRKGGREGGGREEARE